MTKDELDALAHRLAYSCARSDIKCFAKEQLPGDGSVPRVHWYDLTSHIADAFERECMANAVLYLEARGLLRRDDAKPYLATIIDVAADGAAVPPLEPVA